jgi:hypothetical protein
MLIITKYQTYSELRNFNYKLPNFTGQKKL